MEKLEYSISQPTVTTTILIGGKIEDALQRIGERNVIFVTDCNVFQYYRDFFPPKKIIVLKTGEENKTLENVQFILEQFLKENVDRNTFVIAVGGGIVCDTAGFAASVYLRGLSFGFVATTLLSIVDASVGGKNGVNFWGYKNLVGSFTQPKFVICATDYLKTLPFNELCNGLAEVVKHALIADKEFFYFLEKNISSILLLDKELINTIVSKCIKIKTHFVLEDERDNGVRKILNFGHTAAHAYEKILKVSHGEAVAAGMVLAAKISAKKNYISQNDVQRICNLLIKCKLPVSLDVDKTDFLLAILNDKKRVQTTLSYILLEEMGKAKIEEIDLDLLPELIDFK